jgi:hypothetical protein
MYFKHFKYDFESRKKCLIWVGKSKISFWEFQKEVVKVFWIIYGWQLKAAIMKKWRNYGSQKFLKEFEKKKNWKK